MKKALIIGVSGQDGAYLAELLLQKGYEVYGTTRLISSEGHHRLKVLNIQDKLRLFSLNTLHKNEILKLLNQIHPDEVYNLSGQSSVGYSFANQTETFDANTTAVLNLLEAMKEWGGQTKFFNAGSGESFGDHSGHLIDENTPMLPVSPYGLSKADAYLLVKNFRELNKFFCCTGILFNHESPLRTSQFVTMKIIAEALKIKNGESHKLKLGNIEVERDWGWAPEFVEAMWLMLQQEKPEDFIISTGSTTSLKKFVELVFADLGLDWKDYVEVDKSLYRATDVASVHTSPKKAAEKLGWNAKVGIHELVKRMMKASF